MNFLLPATSPEEQGAVERSVDRIHAAKRAERPAYASTACQAPAANVTAWEREIDERVYRLYGLTLEEIMIVEEGAQ